MWVADGNGGVSGTNWNAADMTTMWAALEAPSGDGGPRSRRCRHTFLGTCASKHHQTGPVAP
jgi:hypothetical protein